MRKLVALVILFGVLSQILAETDLERSIQNRLSFVSVMNMTALEGLIRDIEVVVQYNEEYSRFLPVVRSAKIRLVLFQVLVVSGVAVICTAQLEKIFLHPLGQ